MVCAAKGFLPLFGVGAGLLCSTIGANGLAFLAGAAPPSAPIGASDELLCERGCSTEGGEDGAAALNGLLTARSRPPPPPLPLELDAGGAKNGLTTGSADGGEPARKGFGVGGAAVAVAGVAGAAGANGSTAAAAGIVVAVAAKKGFGDTGSSSLPGAASPPPAGLAKNGLGTADPPR